MNAVIEVLLAFWDVIKADARDAREPIYRFFITLSVLAVFVLTLAGGIGMILAGLLMGLMQVMPVYFAAFITGFSSLALAGVLLWVGRSRSSE